MSSAAAAKTPPVIENRKVEAIVIHHTAEKPGFTWEQLSALEYWRLYAKKPERKYETVTRPRYSSGHFRNVAGVKVPVFYSYQWIVRRDGSKERLLGDDEIGYHAGSREWNEKAVAICFDGDYTDKPPSKAALRTAQWLIRWYRKKYHNPSLRVLGHCDVKHNGATQCPGKAFVDGPLKTLTQ